MYVLKAVLVLSILALVEGAATHRIGRPHSRVIHRRAILNREAATGSDSDNTTLGSGSCTLGAWRCDGQILQRTSFASLMPQMHRRG